MRELLEYITVRIVDHPEDVEIHIEEDGSFILLKLKVNPIDMARIIGKEGKIIKSIRSLLKIPAIKQKKKVSLQLVETEPGVMNDA